MVFVPVADYDGDGCQAHRAADEQRGDAQPGFDFGQERYREPCGCGEQPGE